MIEPSSSYFNSAYLLLDTPRRLYLESRDVLPFALGLPKFGQRLRGEPFFGAEGLS